MTTGSMSASYRPPATTASRRQAAPAPAPAPGGALTGVAITLAISVAISVGLAAAAPAVAQGPGAAARAALAEAATVVEAEPYWLHVTPQAGIMAVSRPGEGGGPIASLQLELSHMHPVGVGVTAGYWFPTGSPADPDGPFLEATFAYRFHLQARGLLSPYAGPVAGAIRDDTGEVHEIRGFFGGRGGVDIPVRGRWPAIRLEASYRHLSEAAGRGAGDSMLLLLGGRWSIPFAREPRRVIQPVGRRGG